MKKKNRTYFSLMICAVVSLCVTGCTLGMDDMFEDYNKNFGTGSLIKSQDPGNTEFDQRYLMLPHYAVRDDSTLTLEAPAGCDEYKWELFGRDGSDYGIYPTPTSPSSSGIDPSVHNRAINLRANLIDDSGQLLTFWVPGTNISAGTYKLVLTVKKTIGGEQRIWTDFCTLVIFSPVLE